MERRGMLISSLGHAVIGANDLTHEQEENERAPQIVNLAAQRKVNAGDTRAAETAQADALWMRVYQELVKESVDPKQAMESATAKVDASEREQQDHHAQSYARLVSARDGAADTARVATAAHEDRLNHIPSRSIEELRQDVNRNHSEAARVATRKQFSRP